MDVSQRTDREPISTIDAIWAQYDKGAYNEVLAQTESLSDSSSLTPESLAELKTVRAWSHYRLDNFSESMAEAEQAGELPKALAVKAYLHAFEASPFRDEDALRKVVEALPDSSTEALNALAISARVSESTIAPEEIWKQTEKFLETFDPREASVSDANLINNLSRLAQGKEDFERAVALMDTALEAYGTDDTSCHHRAAANFHLSRMHESLGDDFKALQAAEASLAEWQRQYVIQPIEKFQQRVEGAQERVTTLQGNLSL